MVVFIASSEVLKNTTSPTDEPTTMSFPSEDTPNETGSSFPICHMAVSNQSLVSQSFTRPSRLQVARYCPLCVNSREVISLSCAFHSLSSFLVFESQTRI